jgi:uncharacterized protein YodC (DUF2158 family)
MAFKSGDIVKLKSGSSLMTVESYDSAKGRCVVRHGFETPGCACSGGQG